MAPDENLEGQKKDSFLPIGACAHPHSLSFSLSHTHTSFTLKVKANFDNGNGNPVRDHVGEACGHGKTRLVQSERGIFWHLTPNMLSGTAMGWHVETCDRFY